MINKAMLERSIAWLRSAPRPILLAGAALLLLLTACAGGSVGPERTPSAAGTDEEVAVPFTQPEMTEGWKEVEAPGYPSQPGFSLKLPEGWELAELQGIDSYVGEIVGDGARLHFDYGAYSWSLDPADDPAHEYNVAYEEIGGVPAKLVWPKDSSEGFTGVYFSNLGGPRLSIYGEDLTQEQQSIAFAIFRTVRSLDRYASFFRMSNLAVYYTGNEEHVLEILEAVLGPQFAGG